MKLITYCFSVLLLILSCSVVSASALLPAEAVNCFVTVTNISEGDFVVKKITSKDDSPYCHDLLLDIDNIQIGDTITDNFHPFVSGQVLEVPFARYSSMGPSGPVSGVNYYFSEAKAVNANGALPKTEQQVKESLVPDKQEAKISTEIRRQDILPLHPTPKPETFWQKIINTLSSFLQGLF